MIVLVLYFALVLSAGWKIENNWDSREGWEAGKTKSFHQKCLRLLSSGRAAGWVANTKRWKTNKNDLIMFSLCFFFEGGFRRGKTNSNKWHCNVETIAKYQERQGSMKMWKIGKISLGFWEKFFFLLISSRRLHFLLNSSALSAAAASPPSHDEETTRNMFHV